jgi:hypothetical protein
VEEIECHCSSPPHKESKESCPTANISSFQLFALTTLWQPRFELVGLLLFAELIAWLNFLFGILFDKNSDLELNSDLFALQISSFSLE